MTLPRLDAVMARWKVVPPLSVSVATVAAALGVKVGTPEAKGDDAQGLIDMMGAAGLSSEKPTWLQTTT
jgi:hypothetical protein